MRILACLFAAMLLVLAATKSTNTDDEFYLFGMGLRDKYIYKQGKLYCIATQQCVAKFAYDEQTIIPWEYKVVLKDNGKSIEIYENEKGVFINNDGQVQKMTAGEILNLPNFEEFGANSKVLRVLHHEVLINITEQGPVPNIFTYNRPWLRDAAVMTMVLEKTGNLNLIDKWAESLDYIYDQNNETKEPDNLGQLLYILGAVGKNNHKLISEVLHEVERLESKYGYVNGLTDEQFMPYYQSLWLDLGLKKLGINREIRWPQKKDEYSTTFWYGGYRCQAAETINILEKDRQFINQIVGKKDPYPYLAWAKANFFNTSMPYPINLHRYPLSYEAEASQAKIEKIKWVSNRLFEENTSAPHGWAAAEMFLYLHSHPSSI